MAVVYAYADDEFRVYFEEDVPDLIDDLFRASRVVGFNIRRFDYEVLRGTTARPLEDLPTLDLLDEVERAIGHRVSLDSLLRETLRISKTGDGSQAVRWVEEGEWSKLEKYCIEDVRATKALYEHGRDEGSVSFLDRRRRAVRTIPASWSAAVSAR